MTRRPGPSGLFGMGLDEHGRSGVREVRPAKQNTGVVIAEFWALLLGYQAVGSRFQYWWVEAIWGGEDRKFLRKSNGRTSTLNEDNFAFGAWNAIESGDDGFNIEAGGVNVNGVDYPDQWYKQPIQGERGAAADPGDYGTWDENTAPAVYIRLTIADDGTVVAIFSAMNQHDGQCNRNASCGERYFLTVEEWEDIRRMHADIEVLKRHAFVVE